MKVGPAASPGDCREERIKLATSPTQRTTAVLRAAGSAYDIAETFNHITNRRKDLLGFIDVLAFRVAGGFVEAVGIQVTGGGNGSARIAKILQERRDMATLWLMSGNSIEVHDWVKRKPRGQKVARWICKITPITLADVAEVFA